jgi:DNA helicase HerA-like ATPase
VQHALRAYTPRDRKAVKTAAETFVPNPSLDVAAAIGQLGVGEALVSLLGDHGIPQPVQRTRVAPPRCRMGAISDAERAQVRASSPVAEKYLRSVDRESAAERLAARAQDAAVDAAQPSRPQAADGGEDALGQRIHDWMWGTRRRQGAVETMTKQVARTVGSQLGRQLVRGVLGGLFGGRRR